MKVLFDHRIKKEVDRVLEVLEQLDEGGYAEVAF